MSGGSYLKSGGLFSKSGGSFSKGWGLLAALALWVCPVAALAQTEAGGWNQGRVAAAAEGFAQEIAKLKLEVDRIPPDLTFSQQRAQYELQEDIRLLKSSSAYLAAALKRGEGREQTRPIFLRVESLRADAEENARKTLIPEPLMKQIFAVGGKLLQLQPYYREE